MRLKIAIFAIPILAIALFAVKTAAPLPVAAQGTPTCNDSKVVNTIFDILDKTNTTFKTLPQAKMPDDFATIIDTGILARQNLSDLKIDQTSPCFLAQVSAIQTLTDENEYATYALLASMNLKNSATYQTNLDALRTRAQTDVKLFSSYLGPSATATPTQ